MFKAAVIPTRNRPGDFNDCVRAIAPQVDTVIVIAHGNDAYEYVLETFETLDDEGVLPGCQVIPYDEDPPNISRMWNLGIESVPYASGGEHHYTAILNDDAIVPPTWFDDIVHAMWVKQAAAGSHDASPDTRMPGYAFIIDSKANLRADEQFVWWYGDTDLERRAQHAGGVVKVAGLKVEHRHPNSTTVGVLAHIASEDRTRYERKYE